MNRSTTPAVPAPVDHPDVPDVDQAPEPQQLDELSPAPTAAPPFPAPVQVRLPLRADGKRGSDRIRFRVWQDPRLSGLVQTVVLVISEFVNQAHAARLKGQTIAECAHMSVERCLKAANTAASLGVLAIDRRSHHRRYVFLDSWLRWFGNPAETAESPAETAERHDVSSSHDPERHDVSSSHDTTYRRVTGEPVLENQGRSRSKQQQKATLPLVDLVEPVAEPHSLPPPVRPHAVRPTTKQLRGIDSMGAELRAAGLKPDGPDQPVTRAQADEVFRDRRRQLDETTRSHEWRAGRRRGRGPSWRPAAEKPEEQERAGYDNGDDDEAGQDHEQAASATPAPGAHEDHEEPAPGDEHNPPHPDPAESAQVEPAAPPDPSALRAVFEGLVGRDGGVLHGGSPAAFGCELRGQGLAELAGRQVEPLRKPASDCPPPRRAALRWLGGRAGLAREHEPVFGGWSQLHRHLVGGLP